MAENVLGTLFSDIADAIRSKTGSTETMKPAEFPEQISNIETSNNGEVEDKSPLYATGKLEWQGQETVVSHNLGVIPDIVVVVAKSDGTNNTVSAIVGISSRLKEKSGSDAGVAMLGEASSVVNREWTLEKTVPMASYYSYLHKADEMTFTLTQGSLATFVTGGAVIWMAYGNLI